MALAKSNTNDLASLFKEGYFKIPPYQRRYSWGEKQQLDLLNDLLEAYETKSKHFLGTLSLQLLDTQGFDSYYNLIDGQQRFTTLIILYSCLANISNQENYKLYLKRNNNYFIEPINQDEKEFLISLLEGNNNLTPMTESQKLMLQARNSFNKRLIKHKVDADNILNFILNNTLFLIYLVDDYTASIKMFESINDRGLLLGYFDKLKSFFLYFSDKYVTRSIDTDIQSNFDNIYKFLDRSDLVLTINNDDKLLLYHYLSNPVLFNGWSYTKSTEDIFVSIKKFITDCSQNNIADGKKYIVDYLNDLSSFISSCLDIEEKIKINNMYKEFYLFLEPNQRMFPLSVRFNQLGILDDTIEMLDKIEFYLKFRKDPKKDIFNLLKQVIEFKQSRNDLLIFINNKIYYIYEWLDDAAIDIVNNATWAAKYSLYKLNKKTHNQEFNLNTYKLLEVEHIFSKEPSFPISNYGFDENSYHHLLNNIGNLTLLEKPLNGSAGASNKPPEDKINQDYINSGVSITQNINIQSIDDVKKRSKEIENFISEYFYFELKN